MVSGKREKAVFNWSGGKDSALALYKAQQSEAYEIVSLLTTVNRDNARSANRCSAGTRSNWTTAR